MKVRAKVTLPCALQITQNLSHKLKLLHLVRLDERQFLLLLHLRMYHQRDPVEVDVVNPFHLGYQQEVQSPSELTCLHTHHP